MVDLVSDFGFEALPERLKTPIALEVFRVESEKIKAHWELRERLVQCDMTPDRVYRLTLAITGDREQAEIAKAYAILEESKMKR